MNSNDITHVCIVNIVCVHALLLVSMLCVLLALLLLLNQSHWSSQGESAGEFVRHLTFRLDFNEYYSEKKIAEELQQRQMAAEGEFHQHGLYSSTAMSGSRPLHTQHPEYLKEKSRYQRSTAAPSSVGREERID